MFAPLNGTERYDRTLFNGQGRTIYIETKRKIPLMYYLASDKIVGYLEGQFEVTWYHWFNRGDWYPIELIFDDHSYCGWINAKDIEIKKTPDL